MQKSTVTPLMQQYFAIKQEHPDTLVLFQVGDFYELFFDDAKNAAAFLGIALTKRGKVDGDPIPLCGVPIHAIDHYLSKLVRGGFKVALCDQLEPAQVGKVVARGVTRVLTPGTLTEDHLLDARAPSFLCSFFPTADAWGMLFGEILTGQISATVLPVSARMVLESELSRFFPDEIVLPNTADGKSFQSDFTRMGYYVTPVMVSDDRADSSSWIGQFNQKSRVLIQDHQPVGHALHLFHEYLNKTNQRALAQFNGLQWYQPEDFLQLDVVTQKNLELVKNSYDGTSNHSLFSVIDGAVTAMGSRRIKKWIVRPLVSQEAITHRQELVHDYVHNVGLMQQTKKILSQIGDCERVIGRIALCRAGSVDYSRLLHTLPLFTQLKKVISGSTDSALGHTITNSLFDVTALYNLLFSALYDDTAHDWIIKPGFNAELDQVRDAIATSQQKILALEQEEQHKTGINSLKIRYTPAHGYYIEVTKTHAASVPERYIRRQTLVGKERYTIHALTALQHEIERAQASIERLERDLFDQVKREVLQYSSALRKAAHAVSYLDAIVGFARVAYDNGYVRPDLNQGSDVSIVQGRHPVVERAVGTHFIPNDTQLDDQQSVWVITGPNMGGKSTYLRQVALIAILAQCGSFVPAQSARMPIFDRIFTRIGASDTVAQGKSTFLVEMEETALICTYATKNSLVVLDEVGRGTSTFDGMAIAQAVLEYIHTKIKARSLFATHYHELTQLANQHAGIVNYHAASKKTKNGVMLLHKMSPGVAEGSFGLEVARRVDLPGSIIDRANELMITFSRDVRPVLPEVNSVADNGHEDTVQLEALQVKCAKQAQVLDFFNEIDLDELSPKKAFELVWKIKQGQSD